MQKKYALSCFAFKKCHKKTRLVLFLCDTKHKICFVFMRHKKRFVLFLCDINKICFVFMWHKQDLFCFYVSQTRFVFEHSCSCHKTTHFSTSTLKCHSNKKLSIKYWKAATVSSEVCLFMLFLCALTLMGGIFNCIGSSIPTFVTDSMEN